jgi:hypothetical protein
VPQAKASARTSAKGRAIPPVMGELDSRTAAGVPGGLGRYDGSIDEVGADATAG